MITPSVHQHCRCAQMRKPPHLATLHSDSLPPCGEGSACSLQDNSKIGPGLLLLMSGGRSWNPVGP
jgi:hypothetical protein